MKRLFKLKGSLSQNLRTRIQLFWLVLVTSFLIHLLSYWSSQTIFQGMVWRHYPFHAVLEASGSIAAFFVAYLILALDKRDEGATNNLVIAAALIAMGILDGFHALSLVGNNFVWLHSIATAVGGFIFAFIWLPDSFKINIKGWWPRLVGVLVTLTAMGSIFKPQLIPQMLDAGKFSLAALALNIVGGALLILSSIKFIMLYQKTKKLDDLLFFLHTSLFGLAAIMFQQSQLWDVSWWGWHILRFFAYVVAMIFAYQSLSQIDHDRSVQSEKLASIGELSSGIGHEVGNSLAVASANVKLIKNLLQDDRPNLEKMNKYLGYIEISHERIKRIVDGLRSFSRKVPEEYQRISVNKAVEDTIDLIKNIYKKNGIELSFDMPDEELFIQGSTEKIQQILMNLITNARDATEGLKLREIKLHLDYYKNNQIILSVADNGCGIPQSIRKKILSPFFTTKEYGQGTGLGLGLVTDFLTRMNGELLIDSEVGKGSRFSVIFDRI